MNETTQSKKHHNTWKKRSYKYLRILKANTMRHTKVKEKAKNIIAQKNNKTTWNQTLQHNNKDKKEL